MKMSNDPVVYAFWKYDTFPYVLGDMGKLLPDGGFKSFGYGGATWKRKSIVAIYPIELRREISSKLDSLKDSHSRAQKELSDKMLEIAKEVLPELERVL